MKIQDELEKEMTLYLNAWIEGKELEYFNGIQWVDYMTVKKRRCAGIFDFEDLPFLRIKENETFQ